MSDTKSTVTTQIEYRCPVCGCTATRFEDEEIQCDNRNCSVRPSTRYGKFTESDFTLWSRLAEALTQFD